MGKSKNKNFNQGPDTMEGYPKRRRKNKNSFSKPQPFRGIESIAFFNNRNNNSMNNQRYSNRNNDFNKKCTPNNRYYHRSENKTHMNVTKGKTFNETNESGNPFDPSRGHETRHEKMAMNFGKCFSSPRRKKNANHQGDASPAPRFERKVTIDEPHIISIESNYIGEPYTSKKDNGKSTLDSLKLNFQKNCDTLSWLINPIPEKDFFSNFWEKNPLLISRETRNYYSRIILSASVVDRVLSDNSLFFTKHVDITSYTDGVRETHNPEGRALPHIVWDMYRNGCSVRFLNPQAFVPSIHQLSSELQERLGFVGCNLYLTPAESQGFAPHYDDIEAFVLQIEGSKHWKVYSPLCESETLPRYSSKNLSESDLGAPIIDCILRPGDLLYFPRGFIHQAKTTDEHSLHITLSAYQFTTYVDVLEKVLPNAIKKAAKTSLKLREGLPLDYVHTFGITRNPRYNQERAKMTSKLKRMLHDFVDTLDLDSAVDEFAASKLHDDLPLFMYDDVKKCTVHGNRNTIDPDGRVNKVVQLQLDSKVCLIQINICRLVHEDDKFLLYHSINNSLEYHEREREFLEVPKESVEAVKFLFHSYPNHVQVSDLPIADDEAKWSFANTLWENGLLRTETPLNKIDPAEMDDEDSESNEDEMSET